MEENKVCLNYYQVMVLLVGFDRIEKENKKIDDEIILSLKKYILKRSIENAALPSIIANNLKLYEFSEETYNYAIKLIGIDPSDKKVLKKYKPIIKEIENSIIQDVINKVSNKVKQKTK